MPNRARPCVHFASYTSSWGFLPALRLHLIKKHSIKALVSKLYQGDRQMRTCVILLSAILLAPSLVLAQEAAAPRAELFGGYSYLRNNSNGFNGWTGQGTFNLSRYV